MNTDPTEEDFSLVDSIDTQILMHRDAHFGGKFEFMLDYYKKGGKGAAPEFEIDRIRLLADTEKRTGQNLSAMMLSGADAEKIANARLAYKNLRDLYEIRNSKNRLPSLIADLILSEEEDPENEIAAIIAEQATVVPLLIDLLRSPDFSDPLFPGYGLGPALAVRCLGKIGDKRALISLFEAIGDGDFFNEDLILDAIKAIGEPAKIFLLKVLHGKPLNQDNERAAIALERFKDDQEVCKACLNLLFDPEVRKDIPLAAYLNLICEGLSSQEDRDSFKALANSSELSSALKRDFQATTKLWK